MATLDLDAVLHKFCLLSKQEVIAERRELFESVNGNVKCLFIVVMHLATPSLFTGMPLKLKETNISNKHNRLKNPNWREADQLTIYKHDQGVELGSTEKQLQLSGQSGT